VRPCLRKEKEKREREKEGRSEGRKERRREKKEKRKEGKKIERNRNLLNKIGTHKSILIFLKALSFPLL
jgi:hypothetical protein